MKLRLTLIRHGIAEPKGGHVPDAERALTNEGRARMKQAVTGLQRLGVRFDRLFSSPWVRAVQTAELLAPIVEARVENTPLLAEAPSEALLRLFTTGDVAAVGHQPWLTELAAWLVTGDRAHGERFELKKGGMLVLEGSSAKPGRMTLVTALPPRVLRKLR